MIGNPLTYRGMAFTWKNNKELNSVSKDNTTYNYRYNKDGIRYRKYLENGTVLYQLDGSIFVGEQKQNNGGTLKYDLGFCYDSNDQILSMIYNGVEYYYIKNILKPGKKTVPGEVYGKDLEQKMKDHAGKTKLIVTANGYRKEIDCDLPVNNYLSLLPE